MKSLCILAVFLLHTHVKSQEPCGERIVTGAVGGAVTLRVTDTGSGSITWSFGEKVDNKAITKLGGSLESLDPQYDGRLSGSSDGSLTITNLTQEDQGTYRAQFTNKVKQSCFYDLSVFRNLTDEDITISSNVTYNTTCEVILKCSVNSAKKSNVTVTWRRENSGDISPPTENVVLVPPGHINFTYTCTANNPVSSVSKAVLPREYCERDGTPQETSQRFYIPTVVGVVIFFLVVVGGGVAFWRNIRRRRSSSENKATESKESPSEHDAGNTLYSTVQHVKGKNGKKSKAPKGAVPKPPMETCYATVQVAVTDKNGRKTSSDGGNSTAQEESCYEKVQHTTDKINPKIPPMPAHRGAPKVTQKLPNKPPDPPKTSSKGANRDLPSTPVESAYSEVTLPKATEPAKDPRTL